jgi:hypothetical protein
MLASALSGRSLQVAAVAPGEPAWTDGITIFLASDTSPRRQLETAAVQASLLAAGSLDPAIVRKLSRRPALARRYLALEGHRALAAIEALLPASVRSLIDPDVAATSDSPTASLAAASSREAIPDPPDSFGTIRAAQLLTAIERAGVATMTRERLLGEHGDDLGAELEDGAEEYEGITADLFSNPAGRGGAFGRLLVRALAMVRRLDGAGPPGADGPTHRTQTRTPRAAVALATGLPGSEEAAPIEGDGTRYPEWDLHRRRYREDWCTVREVEPRPDAATPVFARDGHLLRRPLARLGLGLERCHRQAQGDDIDLDAAIEARVAAMAGSARDEAVYVDVLRRRRDLAVLVLLDVSGSVAEPGAQGRSVHEQQRAAAAALTAALHEIGDRVALYAYHSRGRSAVHLVPVKRFDDAFDTRVMRRLHGLVPGAYSRLGAAIRHGSAVLEERGGTPRRLLVVLSDGLAYDHGYEPSYGAADARRALAEARRRGTACLCLSIGASTDVETLRRVFGSAAHATIPGAEQLGQVIGPLFRSALRSAEVRWRASARRRRS